MVSSIPKVDPPPGNSGIIGVYQDPKIVTINPYSHYCWVEGSPKGYPQNLADSTEAEALLPLLC